MEQIDLGNNFERLDDFLENVGKSHVFNSLPNLFNAIYGYIEIKLFYERNNIKSVWLGVKNSNKQ